MKPIIEIRGLGKSYEGRPVLADINLEIGPGELICVIGASGCGKSTLLNLTGGFVKADQGEIRLQVQEAQKSCRLQLLLLLWVLVFSKSA